MSAEVEGMQEMTELLAAGPEVTSLELPAGAVSRLEVSLRYEQGTLLSTSYVFSDDTTFHTLTCTDLTRPDDHWLSIAETFEFLPNAD